MTSLFIGLIGLLTLAEGDTALIRKTADFAITGRGDDPAWNAAGWLPLVNIDGSGGGYPSKSKMLYSSKGIYLLFAGEDKTISTKDYKDDQELYEGDVFELFLHTDPDKPTQFCTFTWDLMRNDNSTQVVQGSFLIPPGAANVQEYQGSGFASQITAPIVICRGKKSGGADSDD